jgi:hypothetical protein
MVSDFFKIGAKMVEKLISEPSAFEFGDSTLRFRTKLFWSEIGNEVFRQVEDHSIVQIGVGTKEISIFEDVALHFNKIQSRIFRLDARRPAFLALDEGFLIGGRRKNIQKT